MSNPFRASAVVTVVELFFAGMATTAVLATALSHPPLWVALPVLLGILFAAITAAVNHPDPAAEVEKSEERIRCQMTLQFEQVLTIIGHYVHDEERTAEHLAQLRAITAEQPAAHDNVVHLPRRR